MLVDNKPILQYKLFASDDQWLNDTNDDDMRFFKDDIEPDLSLIGPCRPDDTPEEQLEQIELCLRTCAERINIMDPTGQNMQSLQEELNKLRNPEEVPFHWNTEIYDRYEQSKANSNVDKLVETSSEEDSDSSSEELQEVAQSLRIGAKSQQHDFTIGNYVIINPGIYLIPLNV